MQQTTPYALDVTVGHVILCVNGTTFQKFIVGGQDSRTWKDPMQNCALYHLLNVNGQIDPSLVVVPIDFRCMLCKKLEGQQLC